MFYCVFYFTCDRSFSTAANRLKKTCRPTQCCFTCSPFGAKTSSAADFTTTADGFGDVNAADGRDQVYNSAASAIEVGYDVTYDAACL